jgi:hypothetical protein
MLATLAVALEPNRDAGFVARWLSAVASGVEVPVAVQLCKLVPAGAAPANQRCNITGDWRSPALHYRCK